MAACTEPARNTGSLQPTSALVADARSGNADGALTIALRGQPISWLNPPYNPGPAVQESDRDGLLVEPCFTDTQPCAFVTTEIWDGFPRVWAQAEYILVTGFDPVAGPQVLPGSLPIFAVPPSSRFYSPFWRIFYVIVPSGFDDDKLHSVEEVLSSGLPLVQGQLDIASIVPQLTEVAHPTGDSPVHPFTGDVLQSRLPQQGWAEDQLIFFLDFGQDRFRITDANSVVTEVATFRFALPDNGGTLRDLGLPPVVGTGLFRAAKATDAPNGFPRYGAFRHEYFVNLTPPPGAPVPGVFVSASRPDLRAAMIAKLGAAYVPVPSVAAEILPEREQYTLRVAVDGSCIVTGSFPDGCIWLDTQAAVENNLQVESFYDTLRFASGGLVFFDAVAP